MPAQGQTIHNVIFQGQHVVLPPGHDSQERLRDANRLAQYAMEIAAAYRVSCDLIPTQTLFQSDGSLQTRTAVNRAIHEIAEQHQQNVNTQLDALIEQHKERWKEAEKGAKQRAIRQHQANIDSYLRNILDYDRARDENVARMIEEETRKAFLEGREPVNVAEEIRKACSGGFWEFFNTTGNIVELITPEIVLTHKLPSAGIDITVPMGKYIAWIDIVARNIKVRAGGNNIFFSSCIHPFFPENHAPCFGNLQGTANEKRAKGEFFEYLTMLQALITTYSHENRPYAQLASFHEQYENNRQHAATAVDPQPEQEEDAEEDFDDED